MYKGQSILIPMGTGGLQTDLPQSRIAPTQLIEARNVTLVNGYCEKHPGSGLWNKPSEIGGETTLPSPIQTFQEYFPNFYSQRVLALCKNGQLYKFNTQYERVLMTPEGTSPATFLVENTAHIAIGGNESAGSARKAFIFSGASPVQVIEGDGTTYRAMKKPAADWSTSYPRFGLIFRSRLWCFGNSNAPDFLYASKEGDQEDFQTVSTPASATDFQYFDVAGGEGNGITGLFVFKNRLYICKGPAGLYQLNDYDLNPANWSITRVNADFGLSNSHGIAQIFDDVLIFNTQGSVTSVSAAFQFGDIQSADLFNSAKVERYFRQVVSGFGTEETYGLYYPDKKQVYFTFRTPSSQYQNGILVLDLFNKQAQISYTDKDQPNCLGLIQDISGIGRPVYGANDGNLYQMDVEDRWVSHTQAYDLYVVPEYWVELYAVGDTDDYEFIAQTPHMDFGFADQTLGLKTKRFDFLEVTFQPTGGWDLDVDVYIDSEFIETISFPLIRDRGLSNVPAISSPPSGFQLDVDYLDGDYPKSIRKPLHGQGRTISFKLRSSGLLENVKIQSLMVYFRAADERQIKDPRT